MNSKVFSLAASLIVTALLIVGSLLCWGAMNTELDPVTKQAVGDAAAVDYSVTYSLALFWISMIAVLGFTVWGIILNPKRFIPSMIGVAVLAIILLICNGMASTVAPDAIAEHPMATEFWLRWADIGIYCTYILFGMAVLLLIVQVFRNIFSYFAK